ncbi:MAG: ABC transporter substrate-binding protein [Clostridia bacterium]|nr:ABC transporter substrate-binding protein [Clostridia bacterium]
MKIWKKIGIISLAFLMLCSTAIMAVGCGNTKDWNKIELNEVTHSIFYAPLYVAINNDYFKDEGLSVSLTNGGGSDTSMSALLTGSADIILAGPETVVYTNQEGVSDAPVVFGQLTTCDGSFIVSKEDEPNFTLADLVGETIIGGRNGGLPAMTLEYIIKQNGYQIGQGTDKINLRTDVAFNLTASVWDGDASIKYCTLFEPTATSIENQGKGHIVASLGKLSGSIPYTCFAAKESYLRNHGDVAEKFLKAVSKAYDFINTASVDAVAAALLPSFEGNTLDDMKAAVVSYKAINAWSNDMILTEASFNNLMNVMLSAGVITERSNWADIVDNTIATKLKNDA